MKRPPSGPPRSAVAGLRLLPLGLLVVALGVWPFGTWGHTRPARAEADRPDVVVETLDAPPLEGALVALDGDTVTVAAAGRDRELPIQRILEIRFSGEPSIISELVHMRVVLTTGERLIGTFAGPTDEGIALDVPSLGRLSVPFDVMRTIVRVPASAPDAYEPEFTVPRADTDVIRLRSRDLYQGIVLAATETELEIEVERGVSRSLKWSEIEVVHLTNEPPPPLEGAFLEVVAREGTLVITQDGVWGETGLACTLRALPKARVVVPGSALRSILPAGGAFVRASTLPFEAEVRPFYEDTDVEQMAKWIGPRADRRTKGHPLRLAGRTYLHGFAVPSFTRLTLPLEAKWSRFRSTFGVDDVALEESKRASMTGGGVVDARVLADDEVLWEAEGVRMGEPPRLIDVDVEGVETLVLEVSWGPDGHQLDRATWAEPILVR